MRATFITALSVSAIATVSLPMAAIANSSAEALMPLEPSVFAVESQAKPEEVAADINAEMDHDQALGDDDMFDLSEVPLLQDFVDEEGRVTLPIDLPFGVTVTDSFGDQALGIDYRF